MRSIRLSTLVAADPGDGGMNSWLSDASNDILQRVAAGAVEANQWMMLKAIDLINSGLRVNLGADWLQEILTTMRYLVLPVVGVLFLLQVVTAMLARSARGLWRAVWGSALGLVLGSACAVLTAGLLLIVDQFSAYLLGDAQTAAQDGIKKAFQMDGAIEASGWLIVTVIAALGIIAWGVVIGVLFLRKAIIIGTVVFGPFAMAGLASGKTKSWAVKWVEVVVALALSKFVICAILTLAYSAVGASVNGDITDAFLGSIWVLLAAFSPLAVLRFAHFASDQIGAANTSGVAGAWGNARQATRLGTAGAGAVGGVVGGTAGWLAGRAGSWDHRSTPQTPSTAVGSQKGSAATAPGSGRPSPTGGASQPPIGGGGQQTAVGAQAAAPASGSEVAGIGTAPTAIGAEQSTAAEAPDSQVQPQLDSYLSQAAQSRSAVVTAAGTSARLGIPQSQADRMFLHYESRGVLGPQQAGGARQVLAPPTTTGATQ